MGIQSMLGITSNTGEDPGGAWFTGEDEFAGGSGTVTRALGCVAAKAAAVGLQTQPQIPGGAWGWGSGSIHLEGPGAAATLRCLPS